MIHIFLLSESICYSQSLTDSLIALYCFDGNANDNYNLNHCTVNGASLTTDRFGAVNKAYYFNGTSAFIELPSKNWIPDNFSLTGWIKVDTLKYFERFFEFGNGVNSENVFYSFTTSSQLSSFTIHDCNNGSWYQRIQPTNTFPTNIWTHIGITFNNSNDSVHIYLNSFLWFKGKLFPQTCNTFKTMNYFGKSGFSNNPDSYFKGKMDDIRIYNRVISEIEVANIYQSPYCLPLPLISSFNFTFPSPCDSLQVQFNDASSSTSSIVAWNWNFGDIASGVNNTSNVQNPIHQFSAAGNYLVNLIVTNGQSISDTFSTNVQVNSNQFVVSAGTNLSLTCITTSGTIGTTTIPGLIYSWSPTSGLNLSNIAQPIASPISSTVYTVTATNSVGCTATSSVFVNVNTAPPFVDAGQMLNLTCITTNGVLGTTAIPGVSYNWLPTAGLNVSNIAQPIASPTSTTIYTVTATNSYGCTNTSSVIVNVNNSPPIVNAGSGLNITCVTTSGSIGSSPISGFSYSWQPAIGLSSSTVSQPTANPLVSTIYTVTATDGNGCIATSSVPVIINNTLPVANAGPPINLNCSNSTSTLGVMAIPGNSYSWMPNAGLNSVNLAQPMASPNATTIYTVTVSGSNGCTATSSVVVTVDKTPPQANAGADWNLTCNNTIGILGAIAIPGMTYHWVPSLGLTSATVAQPIANPTTSTVYTLTVTGSNGCTANDSVSVNVLPLETIELSSDSTICEGDELAITATGGNSYEWSPSNGLNTVSGNVVICSPQQTTTYTIHYQDINGCEGWAQKTIYVHDTPSIVITKSNDIGCFQKSSQLSAYGAKSFSWQPISGLNNVTVPNPIASPLSTTIYTVTASNLYCSAQSAIEVHVDDNLLPDIFIPNSFSPNYDDVNDCFQVVSSQPLKNFHCKIFNRWGQLIFETQDPNQCWNGNYRNSDKPAPMETYFYLVEIQTKCGKTIKKGDITLLR